MVGSLIQTAGDTVKRVSVGTVKPVRRRRRGALNQKLPSAAVTSRTALFRSYRSRRQNASCSTVLKRNRDVI